MKDALAGKFEVFLPRRSTGFPVIRRTGDLACRSFVSAEADLGL
jgi:hypothetical protein